MKIRRALLFGLSTLVVGLTVSSVVIGKSKTSITFAYTNGDAGTYYKSVTNSDMGVNLTKRLNTLNNSKRQRLIPYDNLSSYFSTTDPGKKSGEVTAFYSGTSAKYSGNMNREHVWPWSKLVNNQEPRSQNEGTNEVEQDLHMVRPTMKDENEDRGNSFFTMPDGNGWDPGSKGDESYRGDAARIIFYCTIADLGLTLVDRDYDSKDNHTMGRLSTLLSWNIQYPVKDREKTRNEAVESLQGHRNPFIDHPEYACRIWGDVNYTTRQICASQPIIPTFESLDLNIKEHHMEIGETLQLQVSYLPEGATNLPQLHWGSTNKNVATVTANGSSGTVTAVGNGECNINIYATDDSGAFVSCHITVGSGSSSSSGCGGNITATSVILSTLSILGLSLIIIKRKIKE